jgi:hypothetical protein
MSRKPLHLIAALFAISALSAQAAEFQIFTTPGFGGASIELRGETPDVSGLGNFHDQAASLVVNDRWEVCTEANYRGDCVIVGPGRYPTLNAPIRGRIGSIRPLGVKLAEEYRNSIAAAPPPVLREEIRREPVPMPRERERERARPNRGAVDLFPATDYRGRPFRVDRDEPTLDDFTDRTASLVIHEGVWQLCPETGYRGRCRTLEPGRYPTLRGGVASLRQVR